MWYQNDTMAFTARLPDGLKAEADAYAAAVGVSLNALLSMALRDYLDARKGRSGAQEAANGGDGSASLTPANLQAKLASKMFTPKGGDPRLALDQDEIEPIPRSVMRAPCWCGSGKELRRCHRRLRTAAD
jgi:hypothetical protein